MLTKQKEEFNTIIKVLALLMFYQDIVTDLVSKYMYLILCIYSTT